MKHTPVVPVNSANPMNCYVGGETDKSLVGIIKTQEVNIPLFP